MSLGTRDHVTLDIDATVIHAKKKSADRTDKGQRGLTPMVGHIAETGQVLHAVLRKGNVPPSARNVEFLYCIEALPEGVRISKFRVDAASDQAAVINLCREQDARFATRAKMSQNVRALIAEIPESEWQPVVDEDGSVSETEFLARTLHTMGETPEAFCLVVQKTRVPCKVKPQDPDTPAPPEQMEIKMQEQQLNPVDEESAQKDGFIYRAIATDLDREGFSDAEIVSDGITSVQTARKIVSKNCAVISVVLICPVVHSEPMRSICT